MISTHYAGIALLGLLLTSTWASAAPINGYGAMGASETAGTTLTGSWVPYFTDHRGLNFGGPGAPYNVAVGGARSDTLLTQGQHTDVQLLVQNGDVDLAFLSIGGNDFSAVAGQIASGALTGAALNAWAQGVADNITFAADTVLAANPVGMVVTGLPDSTLTPNGRALFNTPIEISRGQAAVDLVNSILKPAVLSRGLVYVDFAGAMRYLDQSPPVIGGVVIDMVTASANPTHFFQDGVHPAAVGNAMVANQFLAAVNIGYGTTHTLFSDLEILTLAGLAGSYTGETSTVDYADFVYTQVPEPQSVRLALTALAGVAFILRRRSATHLGLPSAG